MKYKKPQDGEFIQKKDYSKTILFNLADFKEKGHMLQVVTIPPQTKQRGHVHHIQTEVEYVLEGEAEFYMNGEYIHTKAGDALITEPGDKHFVWNKTDAECKILVFKINFPEGEEDSVWLEE